MERCSQAIRLITARTTSIASQYWPSQTRLSQRQKIFRTGPAARRSELLNKGRLLRTQDIRHFITAPTFETASEKYARIECELRP